MTPHASAQAQPGAATALARLAHAVEHLDRTRFLRNVAVTGCSRWTYASNRVKMSIDVGGPRRLRGHLGANGTWRSGAPFRAF